MGEKLIVVDPKARAIAFMREYLSAPDGADFEIRAGSIGDNAMPAVGISINGGTVHGFTADEARKVAMIAEDILHRFPTSQEAKGLPNLIIALRFGADEVSRPGSET